MSMSQKDYELIAASLRRARRAAEASGSIDAVIGVDRAIAEVGRDLAAQQRGYAWKQARWEEATEFGKDDLETGVHHLLPCGCLPNSAGAHRKACDLYQKENTHD